MTDAPDIRPGPLVEATQHDSRTLDKVRAALLSQQPDLDEQAVTDRITAMQNEGILFRERCDNPGQVSDGYHTMSELYDHRCALTAVLSTIGAIGGDSWRSKAHHPDDGPMFDGYFIVGIDLPAGPITYHYPLSDWERFAAVQVLEHAPKWDGHDSGDVVDRLLDFSRHLHRASLELGSGTLSFTPEDDPQGTVAFGVRVDDRLGAVPGDEPEETPEEQAAR